MSRETRELADLIAGGIEECAQSIREETATHILASALDIFVYYLADAFRVKGSERLADNLEKAAEPFKDVYISAVWGARDGRKLREALECVIDNKVTPAGAYEGLVNKLRGVAQVPPQDAAAPKLTAASNVPATPVLLDTSSLAGRLEAIHLID